MRTNNIDSVTFSINGIALVPPVLINGGDKLTITIVKTNVGSSRLIIQEKLVR